MGNLAWRGFSVVMAVTAIYLAGDSFRMWQSLSSVPQRMKLAGYAVTLRETVTRAGGAGPVEGALETWALRPDGTKLYRREVVGGDGVAVIGRSIVWASGERLEIDDVREIVTTMDAVGGRVLAAALRDPGSDCRNSFLGRPYSAKDQPAGSKQFGQYQAFGFVRGSSTAWYAPSIDCALIAVEGVPMADGFRSDKRLVSVAFGEPPADLFAVPDRYLEVAPSIVYGYAPGDPLGQAMDRQYAEGRRFERPR